eukprot:8917836-Lingulodinium_polyedra.AAC.1
MVTVSAAGAAAAADETDSSAADEAGAAGAAGGHMTSLAWRCSGLGGNAATGGRGTGAATEVDAGRRCGGGSFGRTVMICGSSWAGS